MNNFVSLMINLLNIQKPELYISELARGTKPGKAARKAMPTCAPEVLEVFGSAKLAVTVYEINEAYGTSVKSCMQGYPVGEYYNLNKIGVIWTNNFRILVRLSDLSPVSNAYGFHGEKAEHYLRSVGLRRVFSDELCETYPLTGPEVAFNPYLDWHGDYYNSDYSSSSYDEDDDYHGENYESESYEDGYYPTDEDYAFALEQPARIRKIQQQERAAQAVYSELLGTLRSGAIEGDFEMEVYLMERLDTVFRETGYLNKTHEHREFCEQVISGQIERRAATTHQFTDMRSLLQAHGYIPRTEAVAPVRASAYDHDEDEKDLPF